MKTIGNIIWFIFVGLGSAIAWFLLGVLWCITIIGIPFGLQSFKLARLTLWPFGADVDTGFGSHPIANVLWIIFGGLELAMGYAVAGLLLCVTVIGIPFGLQCFKLMQLALVPFGAEVA